MTSGGDHAQECDFRVILKRIRGSPTTQRAEKVPLWEILAASNDLEPVMSILQTDQVDRTGLDY